jgi:hypothetical protein
MIVTYFPLTYSRIYEVNLASVKNLFTPRRRCASHELKSKFFFFIHSLGWFLQDVVHNLPDGLRNRWCAR